MDDEGLFIAPPDRNSELKSPSPSSSVQKKSKFSLSSLSLKKLIIVITVAVIAIFVVLYLTGKLHFGSVIVKFANATAPSPSASPP
jgi:hypothetical protein